MASQAAYSDGPVSGSVEDAPLIGNVGQEWVQTTLSVNDPHTAINAIQQRAALRDPRCPPLLGLLDQLGVSRAEAHKTILDRATATLLERIPTMSSEQLLRLLEETFPVIGISELRAVPLAVLDHLRPVPATFIKQLAVDREVFWELPARVQRQAWELDRKLLQMHALSLLAAYTYETATWMQGLNMDESLPAKYTLSQQELAGGPSASPSRPKLPQLARRNLRNGSAALRRLTAMVDHSQVVYRGIVDLCIARYRDSEAQFVGMKEAALCALRSQLLMSLHDAGETGICASEPCYKLAWTLDACLKDKTFDHKRLKELGAICSGFAQAEAKRQRTQKRPKSAGKSKSLGRKGREDDAESAGVPGAFAADEPIRDLGDAGMVLRDPAPFHLMLHQVMRRLEHCVDLQIKPKDDPELLLLTRLLILAMDARPMLINNTYAFAEPNEDLVTYFYPMLADLIVDASIREEDEGDPGTEPPVELVRFTFRQEIARRVVQTYALESLAAGDLITARILLRALATSLDWLVDTAVVEFAPFAFTCARRVATLLADGSLTPDHPLWEVAVDRLLVRLVDAETEVHEEVLRLLLAAAPALEPPRLARYLAATLKNSERSRKLHKKRASEEAALPAGYYDDDVTEGGWDSPGGEEGWAGGPQAGRSADGVRGLYQRFATKQPDLTPATAPELFTYLRSAA